jgi:hypothetical protein
MTFTHEYDFAFSYAGPDQPFVEEVVRAMKARGLRVFFAPDEQADIVGRNLIDYLSEVYLTRARYCLVFISNHYAERKWTDRVERPAAQARALEQRERYIIPVRLDDAKIPGILSTTADIRGATANRIADLAVAILLRDETPIAVSQENQSQERLIIRVLSFTDLDVDLLRDSFKPFRGWVVDNAHMIPVELRLPQFLIETISSYANILESERFQTIDRRTQDQFTRLVTMVREDVFKELLRVPSRVLISSQPSGTPSLALTDIAVELIRRYVLSKIIAVARCLVTFQLKGFSGPMWATKFADCSVLWSDHLMGGLPWLCRSEDSERHLWLDADITWDGMWSNRARVYLPSAMIVRSGDEEYTPDEVLRFVAPQLLERALREKPGFLYDALHYPTRMEVSQRNENIIECHHFHEVNLSNFNWTEALPAIESLRDEIMTQSKLGLITMQDALMRIHDCESAIGHKEIFSSAFQRLWADLRSTRDESAS